MSSDLHTQYFDQEEDNWSPAANAMEFTADIGIDFRDIADGAYLVQVDENFQTVSHRRQTQCNFQYIEDARNLYCHDEL